VNFVNGTLLSSSYIAADANDAVPVSGKASSCVGYLTVRTACPVAPTPGSSYKVHLRRVGVRTNQLGNADGAGSGVTTDVCARRRERVLVCPRSVYHLIQIGNTH